jgi:selenophosphate synthase
MDHILQDWEVENIKNFIKMVPQQVIEQFKKVCDANPSHPKVIAVREELQKRVK